MSASVSSTFPFPVQSGTLPPEGSRAVQITLAWTRYQAINHSFTVPINLLSQYQSGQFTTVQAVWIDNSTCPYAVRLASTATGQTVLAPAFSQGVYPLIVGQAPSFVATMTAFFIGPGYPGATTTFIFLNTPTQPYQSSVLPFGSADALESTAWSGTASPLVLLIGPVAPVVWLLSGFELTLGNSVPWAASGQLQVFVYINSTPSTVTLYADFTPLTAGVAGFIYKASMSFPTPIVVNADILLQLSSVSGTMSGSFIATHGVVTIA